MSWPELGVLEGKVVSALSLSLVSQIVSNMLVEVDDQWFNDYVFSDLVQTLEVPTEVKMFFVPTFTLITMRELSCELSTTRQGGGGTVGETVSADEDNNDSQTPGQSPSNTEHTVWASFRPWAPPSFEPCKQSNAGSVKNQFLKSHSGLNFIPFHPSLRAVHRFNENAAENYKLQRRKCKLQPAQARVGQAESSTLTTSHWSRSNLTALSLVESFPSYACASSLIP